MKMKTILPLALSLVPALLAGCSSARPQSTVTKDSRGNLVIQQDQRRDDYRDNRFQPPFHYYNPVTQQNDWEKYQSPRINHRR